MSTQLSLGRMNRKVGRVWTFSLPALFTCPGSSPWCRRHCYALRLQNLRPNCRAAYEHNLVLSLDTPTFVKAMLDALPRDLACLRLHVSGDFYSRLYVESVRSICAARPHARVWAYTRSWTLRALRPALERLRKLDNVSLFASLDPSMPAPPEGWRVAYVEGDRCAHGQPCAQQHGQEDSCLACGYCFRARRGNVVFRVH